jgi:hypothetical protein
LHWPNGEEVGEDEGEKEGEGGEVGEREGWDGSGDRDGSGDGVVVEVGGTVGSEVEPGLKVGVGWGVITGGWVDAGVGCGVEIGAEVGVVVFEAGGDVPVVEVEVATPVVKPICDPKLRISDERREEWGGRGTNATINASIRKAASRTAVLAGTAVACTYKWEVNWYLRMKAREIYHLFHNNTLLGLRDFEKRKSESVLEIQREIWMLREGYSATYCYNEPLEFDPHSGWNPLLTTPSKLIARNDLNGWCSNKVVCIFNDRYVVKRWIMIMTMSIWFWRMNLLVCKQICRAKLIFRFLGPVRYIFGAIIPYLEIAVSFLVTHNRSVLLRNYPF